MFVLINEWLAIHNEQIKCWADPTWVFRQEGRNRRKESSKEVVVEMKYDEYIVMNICDIN